jgi:phosphoglycerate kinase
MSSIESFDFSGKRALIRVDFNVPLSESFEVKDDTRIVAALPTINNVLDKGGSVVLMSHLGRPKSGPEARYSLQHLIGKLSSLLNRTILFASDCVGDEARRLAQSLKAGEVLLLENLRFHDEEKKGDPVFAKKLAQLGDVYINDAFGTAHRAHASTTVIAQYMKDKMFGYLMEAEVKNGLRVLNEAEHPYTAIIGGAKVSSKIEVITNLLPKIDYLIIGGGMAYTFIKAKGGRIGSSLVEDDHLETASKIIAAAKTHNVTILLPPDSVVADAFANDAQSKVVDSYDIEPGWMGLDVGPEAIASYEEVIAKSKTILWNGPVGVFEMENFAHGTKSLGLMVAKSNAYSLVGGGDSVAAVKQFGLSKDVSYVSTGGGALLELLEGKTLPGVAAIS